MNLEQAIDRLGDWNPQVFRELKGRLSGNTVTFTLVASISLQALGLLWLFNGELSKDKFYNEFQFLNSSLSIGLIIGAIYTLIGDLNREEKQGTFNFIRSSPQSGRSILIGKLLGVPILIYLAVLSIVPLHLLLALASGASLALILAWYGAVGVTTYLCLTGTIFFALLGVKRSILFSFFMLYPVSGMMTIYNHYLNEAIEQASWLTNEANPLLWFYLPVINNVWVFYGFISLTFLVISYWLWEVIDRYYLNPQGTLFSKKESYWLNGNIQIWMLGFALPILTSLTKVDRSAAFDTLTIFSAIDSFTIFWLIALILPSQQSMRAWVVYRHRDIVKEKNCWKPDIIQDLIWHDRSPSILAMGINLVVPAILWILCGTIFLHDLGLLSKLITSIAICTLLISIYTALANSIVLILRKNKNSVIAAIMLLAILPILLGSYLMAMSPSLNQIGMNLLMFSPLYLTALPKLSLLEICIDTIAQVAILVGLTKYFQTQLHKLGAADDRQFNLARTNTMR